uniref:CUB domain-containing protein n=1 Tax=Rhodnius prolixus TaxID=13249 RepID=T1HBP4_RHOPR
MASLSLEPAEIQTYPEALITATLRFQTTFCEPVVNSLEPETWLNLLYCGHSPLQCTFSNNTHKQLLYSEQIRGYPLLRVISLNCELFGMAGHYALALRPSIQDPGEPIASTSTNKTLKAIWSEKFVFNVHARSIFPCDGHSGISVLFQYPSCILPQGDRVRLFSRLRADVSALAPPSSLHYVSEQRVLRGRHSLRFDCSLFSEKYVEYCFVYVSQSVTGAVSDVRMDCVPTLPVLDWETGGWGEWSPWTQCTSTCSGGTRNRYRFCDSPPPRYGAKFCQGHALETESCGVAGSWDCRYYPDTGNGEVPADRPEVKAEVGPGCRCGCIVHLGTGKSRRLIAASSHSCPGRTFWLIQTEKNHSIRLSMEQLRLPCMSQSLKIRDGDASSAEMLARLSGAPLQVPPIISTGPALLIEFNAGDIIITSGEECAGGFLAHISQIDRHEYNLTSPIIAETVRSELWTGNGLINAGLALTVLIAVVATACLGIQYIYRYHKYQLAAAADDMESFTDNSCGSLVVEKKRTSSNATLLSEVISLQRFRSHKHARLSEEDTELQENETMDNFHYCLFAGRFMSPVSPVAEGPEDGEGGSESVPSPKIFRKRPPSRPSASSSQSSTLTNGSSPPSSKGVQNAKETKEKRNRERMLAGSEFSLSGPDLEMDYYDYNVQNAEPGSYLAMDPAYCLWIPPFAPGIWDETEFNGAAPKDGSRGSQESAESLFKEKTNLVTSVSNRALHVLYASEDDSSVNLVEKADLKDRCESPARVHITRRLKEKETKVEKSPSNGSESYDLLDNEGGIRFADEDDEDEVETVQEEISDHELIEPEPCEHKKNTVIVQVHTRNAFYNNKK